MMTIEEVYSKFTIPPNLAEHMLTVAKVVCSMRDHWKGEDIDWDFAIKSALLHDIGNIVKFRFDSNPELMGEEAKNIDYWRGVQKNIIDKYGADDHVASGNMLKEIGVTEDLLNVIQSKSFSNTIKLVKSKDLYSKILLYADMRVMPHGVVPLEDRLADARNRMPKYTSRPDFEELLDAARSIETEIASLLDKPVTDIDWGNVDEADDEFLSRVID